MIRYFFILSMLSTATLLADELSLAGDAKLSGTVRSISEEGLVELSTPLSPETIFLKGASVSNVVFSSSDRNSGVTSSRVVLTNGDVIPAVVRSLDGATLSVESADAGKLEIRRDALSALQFGLGENRVIQSGIESVPDWSGEEILDEWKLDGQTLVMGGPGLVSRKLDLPPRFTIHFQIHWNTAPAFQLTFADPLKEEDENSDRYAFLFNSTGIELRRYTLDGKAPVILGFLKRSLSQYPDKSLKVELRVDRIQRMLFLYLNGEPEGRFLDVVGPSPLEGGISIGNTSMEGAELELSQFKVTEWNPSHDRYRTTERGDKNTDALITRQGERWNGRLVAIDSRATGAVFVFKSDSRPESLELLEGEVSTIFLRDTNPSDKRQVYPFSLQLQGKGILNVASCAFDEMNAKVVHPLLGSLTIPRQRIASLKWAAKKGEEP